MSCTRAWTVAPSALGSRRWPPLIPPAHTGLYTPLPLSASIPPSRHLNSAFKLPPTRPYPPKVAGDAGVDVAVDMVGGELLEPCVRSLNWSGRAVVVGFASGSIPKVRTHLPTG